METRYEPTLDQLREALDYVERFPDEAMTMVSHQALEVMVNATRRLVGILDQSIDQTDRESWRLLSKTDSGVSWTGSSLRCPCACNSGGFCGGCGHVGCGGRR